MAKNIEMNWFNGSGYEALYPNSISNLIQLSETLLDRLGLDNGTIDDIISNSSIFVQATTGCIFWYASETIPEGFLLCDGSLISRTNYAGLFAIIGTTFGTGDGSTTFGIPDLRAKFIRGAGSSDGYSATFGRSQEASAIPMDDNKTCASNVIDYDKRASATQQTIDKMTYNQTTKIGYVRPYNIALTPIIKY